MRDPCSTDSATALGRKAKLELGVESMLDANRRNINICLKNNVIDGLLTLSITIELIFKTEQL